jgi:hypothetical protein
MRTPAQKREQDRARRAAARDSDDRVDTYPGGPRVLAAELGIPIPGGDRISYEQVGDLCVVRYWERRAAERGVAA